MKRPKHWLLSLTILLAVSLAAGYLYMESKKVLRSGNVRLPGLKAPVEVLFDRWAIPHIYARNDEDAYRVLGYVHAQDRLFQMEMMRRVASGTLSEILGKNFVESDRFFRTLRIRRFAEEYAERTLPRMSPSMRGALFAYLSGVNHRLFTGATPMEFDLLGIPREEFTAADVISIAGLMSYNMAYGYKVDPLLTYIKNTLGQEYLDDVKWAPKTGVVRGLQEPGPEGLRGIAASLLRSDAVIAMTGSFAGSNGWVLSGSRTGSGAVILVNDPHMGYSVPSVWYEAHLATPDFELYGHHLAGIPFALLGHNRERSWGLTMFKNDSMDFYREETNPQERNQVLFEDHWETLQVEEEVIHVKDAEPVVAAIRTSRHGPIVSDVIRGMKSLEDVPVSMTWAFHDFENRALEAFYELSHATDLEEFREGVSKIHSPGLNILYGDRDGNIAWWAAARIPIRPEHASGKFILDGASGNDEYSGFLDFSDNPHVVNPSDGILVSANNRPSLSGQDEVAGYYNIDDRAVRIRQLLETGNGFTREDMETIMLDTVSSTALSVQGIVLPILERDPAIRDSTGNIRQSVEIFRRWHGSHRRDEVAPTLYNEFLSQLLLATFADELGEEFYEVFLRTKELDWTIPFILQQPDSRWWDDVHTDHAVERRDEIVASAWLKAIEALEEALGQNIEDWSWGRVHTLEHVHPMGRAKPLNIVFNVGPFPVEGGREVVNKHSFEYFPGAKAVNSGPSTRRVIDFSDPQHSRGINPVGQSGNVFDRHYRDQAVLYHDGKSRTQLMVREEILKDHQGILTLRPD